jgi:Protein of unknown function (DUF3592)
MTSKLISLFRFSQLPVIVLGLILTGVGLFFWATPGLLRSFGSQTWPSVNGRVTDSRWHNKIIGQSALRPTSKFIPKIEYSYSVNSADYRGTSVSLDAFESFDRLTAKSKLEHYATGREVQVFYDPTNPSVSCLELEKPSLFHVVAMILGIVSFFSAFVVMKEMVNPTEVTLTASTKMY